MTGKLNWSGARDHKRAASAQADEWAMDAHLWAVDAAALGLRAKRRPSKAALREIGAKAVSQFKGQIKRLPARRPK
jgi:hypothetical protein